MSDLEKYKNYLLDLGDEIKGYAIEAKKNQIKHKGTSDESFNAGYLAGFHRVITLMQQQAETFDIPLEDMKLHDISENDLL